MIQPVKLAELRALYDRHNRPFEQLFLITMDPYSTTRTPLDNTHPRRCRTVRIKKSGAAVEHSIKNNRFVTAHSNCYWMDNFVERFWFTSLQDSAHTKIEWWERFLRKSISYYWDVDISTKSGCLVHISLKIMPVIGDP